MAIIAAGILGGCMHPNVRPSPPPATPTPIPQSFSEEGLPHFARARIDVIDFQDQVSADKSRITISGKVINRGHTSTMGLRIKISARDQNDKEVESVEAVPSNEQIAPGSTARFSASLPNNPAIVRYHVDTLAR